MEYVEIKKVGKVVTGNTPSKKENKYYDQNYIEFVKPSNFISGKITNIKKGEEYLSYEGMKKGRVANKGDVLVTCIGNIGNVGIVEKKVCFNQQINAIKCNENYINNKYLANVIRYISPLLTHMANKAVVPILNKTQLENIKIPIFSMETQEEIANILEIIQKNIDKRKEQLLLADELIKSRFIEMFGDPIKNDKGWEQKFLEKISSFESKNITKYLKCNNLIWLLNLEDIERNTGKIIKKKMITKFEIPTSIIAFDENYVLYSKLRPYLNKVALPLEEGIGTSELIPIRPRDEVNRIYLFNVLTSESVLKFLKTKVSGAKMPRIIMSDFKKLKISLPGIKLQNEFAEFVTKIDKLKFEAEKSLKEMENLYDSLMQKFFK